jgi:hypothetical protein
MAIWHALKNRNSANFKLAQANDFDMNEKSSCKFQAQVEPFRGDFSWSNKHLKNGSKFPFFGKL